jgi:hypothetical protein
MMDGEDNEIRKALEEIKKDDKTEGFNRSKLEKFI